MSNTTWKALGVAIVLAVSTPSIGSERQEFEAAELRGTHAAYTQFLKAHPSGKYTERARLSLFKLEELERTAWQKAEHVGSPTAFHEFLNQFPEGFRASWVPGKIKELEERSDIQRADKEKSIELYRAFVDKYPQSRDVEYAKRMIAGLTVDNEFSAAMASASIPALEEVIKAHPDSWHVTDAKRRIVALEDEQKEQAVWNEAIVRNTRSGWDDYIARYSDRTRCKDAQSRRDALRGSTAPAPTIAGNSPLIVVRGKLSVIYTLNFFGEGTGVSADGELTVPMIPSGWEIFGNCIKYKVIDTGNTKFSGIANVDRSTEGRVIQQVDLSAIYRVKGKLEGTKITATEIIKEQ